MGLNRSFQEVYEKDDGQIVLYCEKCDSEMSNASSTVSVHNYRRHEYRPSLSSRGTSYHELSCESCGGSFMPDEIVKEYVDGVCVDCGNASHPTFTNCFHCDGSNIVPTMSTVRLPILVCTSCGEEW